MPSNDKNTETKETRTGRYIYDKKLGKVVKISDEIPGLKKTGATGGESCPMSPGAHKCQGCCGH